MSELLLNHPGVYECVSVHDRGVRAVCRWASWWHFWPLGIALTFELQPSSWRSDDLRSEWTKRPVLLSLSPSCLPACCCVLIGGHAELGQSAWRNQAEWRCVLLQITSKKVSVLDERVFFPAYIHTYIYSILHSIYILWLNVLSSTIHKCMYVWKCLNK